MGEGTDFLEGHVLRGVCALCATPDVLLYDGPDGDLICADDYREWAVKNPTRQACDECGSTGNVWRDPLTRKNEYFCASHHDPDSMIVNRWAVKARESVALGQRERIVCGVAGITECKGEIKWRGAFNKLLCNKHAGKQGVGPNG